MNVKLKGVQGLWNRFKYALAVILVGVILLVLPKQEKAAAEIPAPAAETDTTQELSAQISQMLRRISGVGETWVMLTVDTDGQRQLAQDGQLRYSGSVQAPNDYAKTSETVIINAGSGQEGIVTQTRFPTYRGALIVCQGGGDPKVCLAVTEAVAVLTGLPTDRIRVEKSQS